MASGKAVGFQPALEVAGVFRTDGASVNSDQYESKQP